MIRLSTVSSRRRRRLDNRKRPPRRVRGAKKWHRRRDCSRISFLVIPHVERIVGSDNDLYVQCIRSALRSVHRAPVRLGGEGSWVGKGGTCHPNPNLDSKLVWHQKSNKRATSSTRTTEVAMQRPLSNTLTASAISCGFVLLVLAMSISSSMAKILISAMPGAQGLVSSARTEESAQDGEIR